MNIIKRIKVWFERRAEKKREKVFDSADKAFRENEEQHIKSLPFEEVGGVNE